jgi:hypothetical protein
MFEWLFRFLGLSSQKSIGDEAVECMHKLRHKYAYMESALPWRTGVSDEDKLFAFVPPASEFIRINYPRVFSQGEKKVFGLIALAVTAQQKGEDFLLQLPLE